MLQNFLKLALRNLARNRLYASLNILGLSIGIALMVWGFQTYRFSTTWDDFHPNRAQIFRVLVEKEGSDGLKGVCPAPIGELAKTDFSSIAEVVRWDSRGCNVKGDQPEAFGQQVHFTDPQFFDLFDFPLVAGSRDLNDRSAVLITEKTAEKFFGKNDPIGRTLLVYAGEERTLPLTVRGVLKNVPLQSSFRFDVLTHLENMKTSDTTFFKNGDWKWFLDAVIFKIPNPSDAAHLASAFEKYLPPQNAARLDWKISKFRLVSFVEQPAISNRIEANGLIDTPDESATYGPFVIALLIFLSACLNFANTTVARSHRRLREMGVRKTLGGSRFDLMRQVLVECSLLVFAAILLSALINLWWLPTFNSLFEGIEIGANYLRDPDLLWFLGGIWLFTTLLAGSYPAFYISKFNASQVFRGSVQFGGTSLFSRLLLGVQIMVSLITVIAGFAFARNSDFQKNYDYGYNRAGIFGVSLPDQRSFEAFRNAIRDLPGVEDLAGTRNHIGYGYRTPTAESEGQKHEVNSFEIGDNYLKVMGLEMAAGRNFDPKLESDFADAMLITQNTAAEFGWKPAEALGKKIKIDTVQYSVVGIVRDFHQEHLFEELQPQVLRLVRPERYFQLIVRAKTGELKAVHDQVKARWAQLFPLKPFNSFMQDEVGAEALNVTSSIAKIFSWFAIVAMLLTATGLFALVSLTVLKKMKEIALRRVVGAKPLQILGLVNRGYVLVFGIAAVLGCYAGWFLTKLLMDMIFKINVGVEPTTMFFSAAALFLIAGATVGFKVRQAVNANPSDVLRSE